MSERIFAQLFCLLLPALMSCSADLTENSVAAGSAAAAPPSSFDNPIIKYDTADPTNQPGDSIYTADQSR